LDGAVLFDVSNVMNDNDFTGTVEFSVSAGIMPWHDPGEYVQSVTGRAFAVTEGTVWAEPEQDYE
jgi:hypothetical protein